MRIKLMYLKAGSENISEKFYYTLMIKIFPKQMTGSIKPLKLIKRMA
jgi:hypothetical protein